jgi:hypothetical protein
MALQTTRALRGTRTLTRAFFDAADTISLDRRPAVVKAALASIRDELRMAREKSKATKAKTALTAVKKGMATKTTGRRSLASPT